VEYGARPQAKGFQFFFHLLEVAASRHVDHTFLIRDEIEARNLNILGGYLRFENMLSGHRGEV
jgi:hypothetical protein